MPHAARVALNVPTNTRIIAGMLRNAVGEVPSIMAAPRIPTHATTMPIAVAAFTLLVIGSGPRIFRPSRRSLDVPSRPVKRGAPRRGPGRSRVQLGVEAKELLGVCPGHRHPPRTLERPPPAWTSVLPNAVGRERRRGLPEGLLDRAQDAIGLERLDHEVLGAELDRLEHLGLLPEGRAHDDAGGRVVR